MRILGVIPARYASTRLPGKPLADIQGISLIERVYTRASGSKALTDLIVATDDQRIFDAVKAFGGRVRMTRSDHLNGTSRLIEIAASQDPYDGYINIQGDEPFISPKQIDLVCEHLLNNSGTFVSTLIKRLTDLEELDDPGIVKVVIGAAERALYFSRSPIPFIRNKEMLDSWEKEHGFFKHIGIYGFTQSSLKKIIQLKPSSLELAESLEQLRWMENGIDIFTTETMEESISVDTPNDLEKARNYLMNNEQ